MNFYSTNRQSPIVSFREACIRGQAPDKGLYFPETIPVHDPSFFMDIENYSREEIAFRVIQPYVGEDMTEQDLLSVVSETVNFPIPLIPIYDGISSLELYHGHTLAFKDIGARFMSRCLGHFVRKMERQITVLVATSGDTGGAVADGFFGVEGVQVVILFPKGKVSRVQEKQLTTFGGNVHAIAVEGSFDDCQQMVKDAFMDVELTQSLFLTSANSINVARWLPQQFFYLFAWQQWEDKKHPPVISVPSGNFGNICAGLLAKKSGLPVAHFIAACNANKVVPDYLLTGDFTPKPAQATISNAMDVGNPSNFVRISEMFGNNLHTIKEVLSAVSYTDDQTREAIRFLYSRHRYLADPHGAVGFLALSDYLQNHPDQKGIFLETAHPVKFIDAVEPLLGINIDLPEQVQDIMEKEEKLIEMQASTKQLKDWLLAMSQA